MNIRVGEGSGGGATYGHREAVGVGFWDWDWVCVWVLDGGWGKGEERKGRLRGSLKACEVFGKGSNG